MHQSLGGSWISICGSWKFSIYYKELETCSFQQCAKKMQCPPRLGYLKKRQVLQAVKEPDFWSADAPTQREDKWGGVKEDFRHLLSHVQFVTLWHLRAYLFTSVVGVLLWCFTDRRYIQPTIHNQAPLALRCSVQFSLIGSSLLVVSESERCSSPADDFTTRSFITALSVMQYITTTGLLTCWRAWWNTGLVMNSRDFLLSQPL